MLRISAGDRTIGYLYNFIRNGTVSSYQSGFDDSVRGERPGYVCHALAISHYAAAGVQHYDFLAEPNRLKQSFGSERYELYWASVRRPTLSFRAHEVARKMVGRVWRR